MILICRSHHRSGFTLIELLVAVAIIGILATLALPKYQNFRARALQSGVKGELSAAYAAQKGFFAEHQTYHFFMPVTGFVSEGMELKPDGRFAATDAAKRHFQIATGSPGGSVPSLAELGLAVPSGMDYSAGVIYPSSEQPCFIASYANLPAYNATDIEVSLFGSYAQVLQSSFEIIAIGCPGVSLKASEESRLDIWHISDQKVLKHVQDWN